MCMITNFVRGNRGAVAKNCAPSDLGYFDRQGFRKVMPEISLSGLILLTATLCDEKACLISK